MKQIEFENYRNNTDFYENMAQWNKKQSQYFDQNDNLKRVFGNNFYQYQTVAYMSGFDLPHCPRGLLLFHQMGTGKTIEALASSLSAINNLSFYSDKSSPQIIFILNRSLVIKSEKDLQKYISFLNKNNLGLDLKPQKRRIEYQQVRSLIRFIVMNDPINFSDNFEELFGINDLKQHFIIFDEAHNLFRSINNGNDKGIMIYEKLTKARNIQLLFLTGSGIGNNPRELGFCFQMISGNPKLFNLKIKKKEKYVEISSDFDDFFVRQDDMGLAVKHKEIFIKRITGLVSFVEMDLATTAHLLPSLKEIEYKQIQISDKEQVHIYNQEKKNEKRTRAQRGDQFMQRSRIALNMAKKGDIIFSSKFEQIKKDIEQNKGSVQLVYSNFVDQGIVGFAQYCEQTSNIGDYTWQQFNSQQPQKLNDNIIVYAHIHGQIDYQERQNILDNLNNDNNAYGNFIDVILLSPAATEGINTRHVRFVRIIEPQWSQTVIEQVIFRAVRLGSHTSLQEQERAVQPVIYLGYIDEQIDVYQLLVQFDKLSTDQIILIKSLKKQQIIQEFIILLQLGSINCNDYKDIIICQLKHRLSYKQTQDVCFRCEANNKQLFDPNNIQNDISNHNCLSDHKEDSMYLNQCQIIINHVAYSWFLDIYSTYGYRIIEIRNGKYVKEDSSIFEEILHRIKSGDFSQKKEQQSQQQQSVHESEYIQKKKEIKILESEQKKSLSADDKKQFIIDFTKKTIYSKILASKLSIDIILVDEKIGNSLLYSAIRLMEIIDDSIEKTVQNAKQTIQEGKAIPNTPIILQTDNDKEYLFEGRRINQKRIFKDLIYPLYEKNIIFQYSDIISEIRNKMKDNKLLIIKGKQTAELDLQLLVRLINKQ